GALQPDGEPGRRDLPGRLLRQPEDDGAVRLQPAHRPPPRQPGMDGLRPPCEGRVRPHRRNPDRPGGTHRLSLDRPGGETTMLRLMITRRSGVLVAALALLLAAPAARAQGQARPD